MQDSNKIPRWIVENDPSWEKSIDSNMGMLKWTKKGSRVEAVCLPTSMYCEIVGQNESDAGLLDVNSSAARVGKLGTVGAGDIAKYLSSRYLNPGINGPQFNLKRDRRSYERLF